MLSYLGGFSGIESRCPTPPKKDMDHFVIKSWDKSEGRSLCIILIILKDLDFDH